MSRHYHDWPLTNGPSIIAVHGLGADVDKAWTWKRGDILVNWLKDLHMLPSIVEKSRIMVYNYDSAWHANAPKTRLQLRGEALIHHIHSFRTGSADRPIIFIGHSLGGLVVEYVRQTLHYMRSST